MDSEYARLSTVQVPGRALSMRRRSVATDFAEFPIESDEEEQSRLSDSAAGSAKDKVRKLARKGKKLIRDTKNMIPEPIKSHLIPPRTRYQCLEFLFIRLPILEWIWRYKPRQIIGDTVSGVVVGFAHIPEALGIATLAGVAPILGLYTSIVPVFVYAVFGTSNYLSIGTYSLIAVQAGETVEVFTSFARINTICMEEVTSNLTTESMSCLDYSINTAITLSLSSGLFLLAMGILQLGFLNYLLSEAMLSGLTTGAAIATIISQTQFILGLPGEMININSTNFFTPRQVYSFGVLLFGGHVQYASIVIGVLVLAFLIIVKVLNYVLRKKVKKIPLVIPGSLIALVITTAISFAGKFPEEFGISVVGNTSNVFDKDDNNVVSLPPFTGNRINFGLMLDPDFVLFAFSLAVLIYVLSASHARVLAKASGDVIHNHQELIAYGMCNVAGSFFGTIPTASNLSRALLQLSFGGKTQLAGIIAGFIVLFFALFAAQLFAFLPLATLAAVIIVGLDVLLFQFVDLKKFWKLSKWDLLTWIVTFLSVIIINMKIGLLIGFIMSLLIIVLRTVLPVSEALGKASMWNSFTGQYEMVEKIDGILIYRFEAPLHFANVGVFKSRLQKVSGVQLNKKKGNFADSDGFLPKLLRKGGCNVNSCCSCCHGKGAKRDFQKLAEEDLVSPSTPSITHVDNHQKLLDSPNMPLSTTTPPDEPEGHFSESRDRAQSDTNVLEKPITDSKPRRKTYHTYGGDSNTEALLSHRKVASYEDVVLKPKPIKTEATQDPDSGEEPGTVVQENKESEDTGEVVSGSMTSTTSVEDDVPNAVDGDTMSKEDGHPSQRTHVYEEVKLPHKVKMNREPVYVNVETIPFRPKRYLDGKDNEVGQRNYYNLPLVMPGRHVSRHTLGGVSLNADDKDYYSSDHLQVPEEDRQSGTTAHSEHSNDDDLCQVPRLPNISVKHLIKRKLVQGEEIDDIAQFEELSASFVRKLDHATDHLYHTIILDCAPISFIDSAGALLLHKLIKDFSKVGIEFILSAPSRYFITSFEKLGFCKRCSQHFIFPTIQSAVEYATSAERKERPRSALMDELHDDDNVVLIGYLEKRVQSNRRLDFESSFSWLGGGSPESGRARATSVYSGLSRDDMFTQTV